MLGLGPETVTLDVAFQLLTSPLHQKPVPKSMFFNKLNYVNIPNIFILAVFFKEKLTNGQNLMKTCGL